MLHVWVPFTHIFFKCMVNIPWSIWVSYGISSMPTPFWPYGSAPDTYWSAVEKRLVDDNKGGATQRVIHALLWQPGKSWLSTK